MGWLYRQADQHKCPRPDVTRESYGDLWQCDTCGALYQVKSDQRDGNWLELVPADQVASVLNKKKIQTN